MAIWKGKSEKESNIGRKRYGQVEDDRERERERGREIEKEREGERKRERDPIQCYTVFQIEIRWNQTTRLESRVL